MGAISAAGVLSTLSTAATVLKTLDTTFSVIQNFGHSADKDAADAELARQNLALTQLQARQGLAESSAAQDAALQKQRLAADAAARDAARLSALRRAVARQNAQTGASGIAPGDGSSEAILLGLNRQSDDEKTQQDALDTLRFKAIDDGLEQKGNADVLQRTQLAQTQNLQRVIADA